MVPAPGAGVQGLKIGQRVAFGTAARGGYAEHLNLPAWQLAPVPDAVSNEQAAAVMLQGMTAHYLSAFALQAGQLAVVHAAAGGVGGLLVQMAARLGVTVRVMAGSPEKLALARDLSASLTAGYEDFAALAREHGGADVVDDGVGKSTFSAGLDALRVRGLMYLYRAASGAVPPIAPQTLNEQGGLFLTRPSRVHDTQTAEELRGRAADLFAWMASGELKVRIDRVFPLAQVAEAHRFLEGRNTLGKVLLSL
ncbi:zinc-binding dehydrogenase [Deinococcus sp.]|uniref:zinc-binding dehydrogenase n=1 Tax=Deinococcus sp. TaxID=47478 RepID=UPI003CC62518